MNDLSSLDTPGTGEGLDKRVDVIPIFIAGRGTPRFMLGRSGLAGEGIEKEGGCWGVGKKETFEVILSKKKKEINFYAFFHRSILFESYYYHLKKRLFFFIFFHFDSFEKK